MTKDLEPLYYAIVRHFQKVEQDCAEGVVAALDPDYHGYKMLTVKDVDEALATAAENGLLEETTCDLGQKQQLRISYALTEFGDHMIKRYLKD